MNAATVEGYDATGVNVEYLPVGQVAGYVTGTGGVPWTSAQWAAHPGAVRIDQSPVNTPADETADVLDYESGAAALADLAPWAKAALANFRNGTRPGQRSPAIYASASNITAVVNTLIAGGITSGIGLGVADYSVSEAEATLAVANASGPFPVVWYQYSDQGGGGTYDLGIFSVPWLANVSKAPSPDPVRNLSMLIIRTTAPAGYAWAGTRDYLYLAGSLPVHIVGTADLEAFLSVSLSRITVTWAQYLELGGT